MLFGMRLYSNKVSSSNVLGGALGASFIFFIVSNFGVWMHPAYVNLSGTSSNLLACYIDAIPFFQNTLASNLFYSAVLFGSYYALQAKFQVLKLQHIKYYTK